MWINGFPDARAVRPYLGQAVFYGQEGLVYRYIFPGTALSDSLHKPFSPHCAHFGFRAVQT